MPPALRGGSCLPARARIAHAASKRALVAHERPEHWTPPSMFCPPEVLTEAEVAEAELKNLQRHFLELVDLKVTN